MLLAHGVGGLLSFTMVWLKHTLDYCAKLNLFQNVPRKENGSSQLFIIRNANHIYMYKNNASQKKFEL